MQLIPYPSGGAEDNGSIAPELIPVTSSSSGSGVPAAPGSTGSEEAGGSLTFLFTDIESSARLWDENPQAMHGALGRHDAIVRGAIEASGGQVFKTVGDAFCAAFGDPRAAVEAAVAAQQQLQRGVLEYGSDGVMGSPASAPVDTQYSNAPTLHHSIPLRVRMALHAGVAQRRDGDYFGPALNRVARLLAAGHGGQVLLSQSVYEQVGTALPAGCNLRDLGERRLRGLAQPERIYQLEAPGLPTSFPPLNTLDARPGNLPAYPAACPGREKEVAELEALLRRAGVRLVTLVGPEGAGKTPLSLSVATDLVDEFEGGAWFVPLAEVSDPALVVGAVAQALAVFETPGEPLAQTVKKFLRERQLLLVLDHFDPVLDAAPLVTELLAAAPGVKALVSSREALLLYGEHEFPIPAARPI